VKYNTFYLVQNKTKGKIMTVMRSHFFQQLASSTMVNIQNKQTMATSTSVMAASKSAARTGEMAWAKVPKVVRKICRD
jgi:imidazoleglycerol phosphate dehydratase HisB